jgi:hypothetical protein
MSEPKPQLPLYSIMVWRGLTNISPAQNWLTKILDHYEVRATENTGLNVVSSRHRRDFSLLHKWQTLIWAHTASYSRIMGIVSL